MKYELVSLNVRIGNKLFRKELSPDLDDSKLNKAECEAAYKAGFIKPKGTKAKTPGEVIVQYKADQQKPVEIPEEAVKESPGEGEEQAVKKPKQAKK